MFMVIRAVDCILSTKINRNPACTTHLYLFLAKNSQLFMILNQLRI